MLVGERLEELRKDAELTQQQLAQVLSLKSYKTISGYENETTEPPDEIKIKMARYFDVSLDYLMGLTDERISYARRQHVTLPPHCPPEVRAELLNHLSLLKLKYGLK